MQLSICQSTSLSICQTSTAEICFETNQVPGPVAVAAVARFDAREGSHLQSPWPQLHQRLGRMEVLPSLGATWCCAKRSTRCAEFSLRNLLVGSDFIAGGTPPVFIKLAIDSNKATHFGGYDLRNHQLVDQSWNQRVGW